MSDDEKLRRRVMDLAGTACQRVFAAYGVRLDPIEDKQAAPPIQFLLSGIVGFAGRSVRGSIILVATAGPLDRSDPVQRPQPTRDWIGELANQVAGHIKSSLLAYDVDLYVNLPAVISGSHLAPLPRRDTPPIAFANEDGVVCLWVDVEADDGFVMRDDPEPALAGRESGEPLLFDGGGQDGVEVAVKRVLVIDDSLSVRQQVAGLLREAGYQVEEAADGVEGLAAIKAGGEWSLLICDVNMPRMNGLEMIESLRRERTFARLPVLMLTSEGQPSMIERARKAGASGWVVKPFQPRLLVAAVGKLTDVDRGPVSGS